MARYRIDSIADLARQMTFTPLEVRAQQVEAAEGLLHDLEPSRAYPLEFIVFRISGFTPQSKETGALLTGMALQHDLGLLVEHVSETLNLQAEAQEQPVLQIDDVCEKFNVTSKTVQRWRRKGLAARKFVFADGKRRVGFQLASVERFFRKNQDNVLRATNFSQVDPSEGDDIVRRAKRLALMCHCCQHEISRRIGRKLNRSPLTVAQIIRRYDEAHPNDAVFALAPEPITPDERTRILRGYRRGLALRRLARRTCRPKSAIWRVITTERLAKLNKRKVKFIDDPLYHQPEAAGVVDQIVRASFEQALDTPSTGAMPGNRVPRDLPPYLAELYRSALLTPAQERALFIQFNLHKFQFVGARRKIEEQFVRSRDINQLETLLRRVTDVKNKLLQANLRLVVSVARKHVRTGVSLMELVSEGNLTLMRAVEGFDVHKGYKFSTYATLALMKEFARAVPTLLAHRAGKPTDALMDGLLDVRGTQSAERFAQRDEIGMLLGKLDDRERAVLVAHFGLGEPSERSRAADPLTYAELGKQLGLTKQRVRQIEQGALSKLRLAAGVV